MTYLGIDIGGTKTLVATLNNDGVIQESFRFATPKVYADFLQELANTIAKLTTKDFSVAAAGVPGLLDRENGIALALRNLPWHNISIQMDIEHLVGCPVVIENDTRLAALSEAMLLKDAFRKVLYLTVSTGVGMGVILGGTIDSALNDSEAADMEIEHDGKLQPWESFASGKAIVKQFGKRASDIHDAKTWRIIAANLAKGLINLIAIVQPDVIVFGGGVGQYLDRFEKFLTADLKKFENPMMAIPPVRVAARPEEAVIYGCYDLAKATYGRFYS